MINSPRRMQLFPRQLPSATGVASSIDGFRRLQVLVSRGYVQDGNAGKGAKRRCRYFTYSARFLVGRNGVALLCPCQPTWIGVGYVQGK